MKPLLGIGLIKNINLLRFATFGPETNQYFRAILAVEHCKLPLSIVNEDRKRNVTKAMNEPKYLIKNMIDMAGDISRVAEIGAYGRVAGIRGLLVEVSGPLHMLSVGQHMRVDTRGGSVMVEVIGFDGDKALCMPFAGLDGVRLGAQAAVVAGSGFVRPTNAWLGRVVNAFGEPIDGKGALPQGEMIPIRGVPPAAHARARVGEPLDLGVRALNTFITCCKGQRLGIFAGSGVGKSVLMSMLARNTNCDVAIIGLIGERGREVQEFIEDNLGEEGLKRSIVVVATSDESPLMRRQAAYLTLALSEFFRDTKKDVLCMMDSVTRFAMAQREIGLATGEPPATKGYTPTVFAELPKLLERAGPGEKGSGTVTGLFTVLVEGDNHNEPVADAVRGILDGHIVMERSIAERGRFPAINILKSVSRTMPECVPEAERETIRRAKTLMATYNDMEELIRLGAYRRGTSPEVDESIHYYPFFENFLTQGKQEITNLGACYEKLRNIFEADSEGQTDFEE